MIKYGIGLEWSQNFVKMLKRGFMPQVKSMPQKGLSCNQVRSSYLDCQVDLNQNKVQMVLGTSSSG